MFSPSLTRKILLSGLVVGLPAAFLAGCDRQSGGDTQPPAASESPANATGEAPAGVDRSHKGSRLPSLGFKDAGGKTINTASLAGKPVLINLWATWCGPCVAELPTLDKLAGEGRLRVLTISQDTGDSDKVASFLQGKGLAHLDPWLDPEGAAASQWQVSTLPASIYYDAQGREVWRANGGMDWKGPVAAKLLAEAAG